MNDEQSEANAPSDLAALVAEIERLRAEAAVHEARWAKVCAFLNALEAAP